MLTDILQPVGQSDEPSWFFAATHFLSGSTGSNNFIPVLIDLRFLMGVTILMCLNMVHIMGMELVLFHLMVAALKLFTFFLLKLAFEFKFFFELFLASVLFVEGFV